MKNSMDRDIIQVNQDFYNHSGDCFDKIPFDKILPELLSKYKICNEVLEIGSGAGALAAYLKDQLGCMMTCLEPAKELALKASLKSLRVLPVSIQEFKPNQKYDHVIAISSLIHLAKQELPSQLEKIATILKPQGLFIVSFIEGTEEGFEDPTKTGKLRYFSKWTEPKELGKNNCYTLVQV